MKNNLKKRGQKFIRKFSRASAKASEDGREHIRENLVERISHIRDIKLLIFEWVLLVSAVIMLAVAQAFWFSESYATDVYVQGGNYVEATVGRVNSLNPLFATTRSEKALSRLMFATLISVDYSGNLGPGLAESIRASENGRVWTVKLRDGLLWSDGEPITNEDVLFTIDLIQNPVVGTIYDSNLRAAKVAENESGEIVFTLGSAYADFASALTFPIVPKHELEDAAPKTLIEDDFSNQPVTSGAFKFNAMQASTTSGERVVYLSANENYYLGRPKLDSFAIHAYATKEEIVAAVNSGKVTATAELSGPEADVVTATNFLKRDAAINSGAFIFFNLENPSLAKSALRRAIREGIDVAALREVASGTLALDFPFLNSQITIVEKPVLPEHNFEAAAEKITEIKGDGELSLSIVTVDSGYLPRVAEVLAEQLRSLGITVEVTTHAENQEFVANVIAKRGYDILLYEIELGADPDPLAYYHSSQARETGLNLSNYQNTLVDDLLVGARETMDDTLRAKKYETFLQYFVTDAPAIGLYQSNLTYIYNRNVRTFSDSLHLVTGLDRFGDANEWAAVKGTRNLTP